MNLHKFENTQRLLPTDDECERLYKFLHCLTYFKFCTYQFDQMPKILHRELHLVNLIKLCQENIFWGKRETLSEIKKKQVLITILKQIIYLQNKILCQLSKS